VRPARHPCGGSSGCRQLVSLGPALVRPPLVLAAVRLADQPVEVLRTHPQPRPPHRLVATDNARTSAVATPSLVGLLQPRALAAHDGRLIAARPPPLLLPIPNRCIAGSYAVARARLISPHRSGSTCRQRAVTGRRDSPLSLADPALLDGPLGPLRPRRPPPGVGVPCCPRLADPERSGCGRCTQTRAEDRAVRTIPIKMNRQSGGTMR